MRILWIPHAAWRIPQRAHLFCRALSERHEVHATDWAADFYSVWDYLSPRYLQNFFYRRSRTGPVTVHGIPRVSPAIFSSILRRLNTSIFSAWVERIIRQYRIDVVVGSFVVNPPKAPRLIFDLSDDNVAYWRQGGRALDYAKEIEASERAYLAKADAVVAASSVLADNIRSFTSRPIYHIPNAVELSRFRRTRAAFVRSQWQAHGIVIGMLGNHDKFAELQKVLYAAERMRKEELTFVIAGRGSALPQLRRQVAKEGLSNIRFMANVSIIRGADVVSAFDIGLCPYAKSAGTDAASPMRLLQYSAAGLPIVCTDVEEVRRMGFPNVVLVDENPDSLVRGIRRAMKLPRARPKQIAVYDLARLSVQYEAVMMGTRLPDDKSILRRPTRRQ